jgi:hypothetical protein
MVEYAALDSPKNPSDYGYCFTPAMDMIPPEQKEFGK